MPSVHFRSHHYPSVWVDGTQAQLSLKRGLALLACLSEAGRPLARALVAQWLWPDAAEALGRARLRRLVHQVHAGLGCAPIAGDGQTLWLDPYSGFHCDVAAVRTCAQALLQADAPAPEAQCAQRLLAPDAALFLQGFTLDSDLFFDWLARHRAEHERLVGRALLRLAAHCSQADEPAQAAGAAAQALAIDACNEAAYIALFGALGALGKQAELESAYFRCAQALREELGVRPSPLVEEAYVRARSGSDAAGAAVAPPLAIRFAHTGEGAVAYVALGEGPQTLVLIPGLFSHLEVSLGEARMVQVLNRLARRYRVLLLDRRGTGLSERVGVSPTADTAIEDILAVLDAAGVERAWVFGASVGGTIGIAFAAQQPARCAGLLLFGANARGAWAPDYPFAMDDAAVARWIGLLQADWGGATSLAMFAPSSAHDPAVQAWWARLLRQAASPNSMAALVRAFHAMDVRPQLPQLELPTLVLQRRSDRIVRQGAGEYLAQHIPGAKLVLLAGEDHFFWHGDTAAVLNAIEGFTG